MGVISNGCTISLRQTLSEIEDLLYSKFKLHSGDVVFARTGATTGKSYLIIDPPDSVFASYLIRVRLEKQKALPEFVNYFFQSADYWYAIQQGVSGSAQGGFNATKLGELDIPVPPLHEQRRIVGILDKAFAAIATAKANSERNLENSREIFEGSLNDIFTREAQNWPKKTLDEISLYFGRGKSKHRPRNAPHLYGGRFPFIQTGDIRNADHVITAYSQTYNDAGLAQSKLWPKGTVCITIAANIAETAILGFDACFPDSVIGMVVDPKKAIDGFVEYLLQYFKIHIKVLGKGSAQDNINLGTFENMRFPIPQLDVQNKYIGLFNTLAYETQRLAAYYNKKITYCDELKQSLLHQAFTGAL